MLIICGHSDPIMKEQSLLPLPDWTAQVPHPAFYPRQYLDLAIGRGHTTQEIAQQAGVPYSLVEALLEKNDTRISLSDSWQLVEAVRQLTDDGNIGFRIGLSMPLTSHGPLAYAAMCAATPRQAIEVVEKFWHLRLRGVSIHRNQIDQGLLLALTPDLPLAQGFRDIMMAATLTAMLRAMEFVLPTSNEKQIWLQGAEPDGFQDLGASLPLVFFNQPRSGLFIGNDPPWLDLPLPTANAEAFEIAYVQCERESALYDDHQIVRRVRTALTSSPDGYPSTNELAEQLNLSPRTLRRRLNQEGRSYKQLLDEARCRDCEELLMGSDLSMQQIGERLGYSEHANFARAFRRWTGMTPSQWRKKQEATQGASAEFVSRPLD